MSSPTTLLQYRNGNADITMYSDGTRVIDYEDDLKLEYPLNVDIKVSNQCSFGLNVKTGKSFCDFCHESALTQGSEADFHKLASLIQQLPKGTELAIGCNEFTHNLYEFIQRISLAGYFINLTVNQGHLSRDLTLIESAIENDYIKGLGVSYRSTLKWKVPMSILLHSDTVFHVIAGIDTVQDVLYLAEHGVSKVLVLGEKNFGFNTGKVDLTSRRHKEWFWWINRLFEDFEVVSFDNLALEQLNIKRFFKDKDWEVFNQGEHSFYIDAVTQEFARSSRSAERYSWNNFTIKEYFELVENEKTIN